MSDNEEFDPAVFQALRDVPPASGSLRDAHIAAALAEMAPSSRTAPGRLRVLGSVAAAAVIALGGFSVLRQNSSDDPGLSGANSTLPPKASATCASDFAELLSEVSDSKEITHNGIRFALMLRDDAIDVYLATPPCSAVGTMDYRQPQVDRDYESPGSVDTAICKLPAESIVRQFTDSANGDAYSFVLIHSDNGLSLYFADRCDTPIATLDLP